MSALTYEIKDLHSPVAIWLRSTLPHHKTVQAEFRQAAGVTRIIPSPRVASGTQGAAIDWWLRTLVDPQPTLGLAYHGIVDGEAKFGARPWVHAGRELLAVLAGVEAGRDMMLLSMDKTKIAGENDEWWARVSYALALLTEPLRAYTIDGSRLLQLGAGSGIEELLALANTDEVADLIAMRDLATERLLPHLPDGPVFSGPTFDGSVDLNGDADLIVGGMLLDIKASQGGSPRKDGTRPARLDRPEIDQLLGYTLMDYSDHYQLHTVAIYAARFGYFAAWPIAQLCATLAGQPTDLADLRNQFAKVLQVELPAYWASQRG